MAAISPRVPQGNTTATTSRESITSSAAQSAATSEAPAKATAAPKGDTQYKFTSLVEALNKYQEDLAKEKAYEHPDVYEIKFSPPSLGEATLSKDGVTNKSSTPMQNADTAKEKVDPGTNRMNTDGRTVSITAGQQIIQFIEQVMRGSTYITDQQKYIIDETTQEEVKNSSNNGQPTIWFKVNVQATPLAYDKVRKDYAYKMTYIITPFQIAEVKSEYFNDSKWRGAHKAYNYWFTGENTQVLDFSQNFNYLYNAVASGIQPDLVESFTNSIVQYKVTKQTRSAATDQGAEGATNEPAANAADELFSPSDQTNITLKIVGDPAWLQQGEVVGVDSDNFDFNPFLPDGTINFDSQEIVFTMAWNQPADYNLSTGLMEINSSNRTPGGMFGQNLPQEIAAYKAITCTSTFSKGRFEQTIVGQLLTNVNPDVLGKFNQDAGRGTDPFSQAAAGVRDVVNKVESTFTETKKAITSDTTNYSSTTNVQNTFSASSKNPPTSNGAVEDQSNTSNRANNAGEADPSRTNQKIVRET